MHHEITEVPYHGSDNKIATLEGLPSMEAYYQLFLLPTLQSPKHVDPVGVVGAISRSLYNRTLAAISSIVVLQLESLQRHRFQGSSHKSLGCNVDT